MNRLLRSLFLLRGVVASLIVLAILLVVIDASFCYRAGSLDTVKEEKNIILRGKVKEMFGEPLGDSFYIFADESGSVYVLTHVGLPRDGAFVFVWGTKTTTDEGRTIIVERRRVGTF